MILFLFIGEVLKYFFKNLFFSSRGECSVCQRPLDRLDLSEKEFREMRKCFLETVLVGNDIFQRSTPEELQKFITFVSKNAPFNIVLDGLNVAYMSGTSVAQEVNVGLVSSKFLFSILISTCILVHQ